MKLNFYSGTSVSAWLLTALVIVAELVEPFKESLKTVFTHHWIGKGILIIIAFIVFSLLLKEKETDEKVSWYSVIGSFAVIFLFYLIHYFIQ